MIKLFKNLLPGEVLRGVAPNLEFSKIKLRFPKRVSLLAISLYCLFSLLGYYPALTFPPVKRTVAHAQTQEQKGEVIASSFSKPLILPHPGYLSTRFSNYHPGIDIASGLSMPVHPIIDGEVVETGFNIWGLGNTVTIAHENGFKSMYAHMGRIFVKVGQKVTSENTIGGVGLTGKTSGPHTHLEITHNGNYIDPQTILPELPPMPYIPTFAKK